MNEPEIINPESEPDTTDAEAVAESTVPGAVAEDALSELQAALEATRLEAQRFRDEALRARAEVDNVRKRAQRDVESAHKFGIERLVEAFIPVKDSLDLGYDAAQTTTDIKTLQEGMVLTQQLFDSAFGKLGVQPVSPEGARFDPALHQAMMAEPSTTAEPGTVLRVMQQGYVLHDRLIRPALVVVAKAPEGT